VHWGQVIVGPPGAGKTSYTRALYDMLVAAGRPAVIVNLDPANEDPPFEECKVIDIRKIIALEDVAAAFGLGPNGGLMYCVEFLERNEDWLENEMAAYPGHYFLLDCPGQAELYTHHSSFFRVLQRLTKAEYRLVAVHLVDVHHCTDPAKFLAVSLVALMAMIRLELPHINVLSKVDQMGTLGGMVFSLDFLTESMDLHEVAGGVRDGSAIGHTRERAVAVRRDRARAAAVALARMRGEPPPPDVEDDDDDGGGDDDGEDDDGTDASIGRRRPQTFLQRYRRLNDRLAGVIQDYNLLAYLPVTLREPRTLLRLAKLADKAVGFVPIRGVAAATGDAIVAAPAEDHDLDRDLEERFSATAYRAPS